MTKSIGAMARDPGELANWTSQALTGLTVLGAVARTRVLDHLDSEARSVDEIASEASLDPSFLARMLEYLASQEILVCDERGAYGHTPFSRMLRSDHPSNLRAIFHVNGDALAASAVMDEALRTGVSPQEVRHGVGYFERVKGDPALADAFARLMSLTTTRAEQAIIAGHAFEAFDLAVDVGGSHGSLLKKLLAGHERAHGIVFDLPEVVAKAELGASDSAVRARIDFVGGSFFDAVPAGADLYLLKQILHDWGDDECIAILERIRQAITPGGRLAVIERIMPDRPEPNAAYFMDIFMLLLMDGRERKRSELEELLTRAGFRVQRITDGGDLPSVIEAVPA